MTEEEMKTKECPTRISITMLAGTDAKMCDVGLCSASACAMWEPEYEEESMTIIEKDETPKGWHERRGATECSKHKYLGVVGPSRLVFKQTESNKGDCGLKTKESGCFYPP